MKPIEHLNEIKQRLNLGLLSYEEAKEAAKPHLEAINEQAKEIAKKHGVKPKPITFIGFMR